MTLFEDTENKTIIYNGTNLDKMYFNGTKVYEKVQNIPFQFKANVSWSTDWYVTEHGSFWAGGGGYNYDASFTTISNKELTLYIKLRDWLDLGNGPVYFNSRNVPTQEFHIPATTHGEWYSGTLSKFPGAGGQLGGVESFNPRYYVGFSISLDNVNFTDYMIGGGSLYPPSGVVVSAQVIIPT